MSVGAGDPRAPAAATGRTSLSVIARSGSINLVGTAAGALLTLGLTAAIARGTPTSVAGAVFATTSLFLVVAAMAEVGSDVSLARFVPRCVTAGRPQQARLLVRAAVLTASAVGLLLGAALVLARAPVAAVLSGPSLRDDVEAAVVVLALAVPLAAGANTLLAATRGLGTVRPTVLIEKLGRGGLQLVLVLLAVASGAGVAVLAAAWAAPYVLAAVAARLSYGSLTRSWRSPTPEPADVRSTLREYAAFTWPRAVSRLCQIIMQRADIVLVAALRSPAEAAVYTVATRFLVIGQLAVQAVQQVLAPQASGLLASGDEREAVRVFQTTTAWTMALTWPMYLWSMGAASLLLTLLGGEEYRSGATVVTVLACAALVASAGGPVDTMLLMAGRSGLSLINNVIGLVLLLTLAVLLIPGAGMTGAALAWASAIVVRNLLGVAQVRRLLGAWPYTRSTVIVVSSAMLAFGVPAALLRSTGQGGALPLLLAGVLGSLLHLGLLWQARRQLGLAELDAWPTRSRASGRSVAATR